VQAAEAGELREQVEQLRREVADLAARVKQNSKNSSRPPSSDGLGEPAPKSLRKRTGRRPGRPKGQPGTTMSLTDHPDHVIRHEPGCCGRCGAGLGGARVTGLERRQVTEIPPVTAEVTEHVFALLRLLPMSSRDKDAEILTLRHQLLVLRRQLAPDRVRFTPGDWALLAALLRRLPRDVLKRVHLVVSPDRVLRWHRDLVAHRRAQRSCPRSQVGRAPCGRGPGHVLLTVLGLRGCHPGAAFPRANNPWAVLGG
jgi:Family of unknown function (DUF6444)